MKEELGIKSTSPIILLVGFSRQKIKELRVALAGYTLIFKKDFSEAKAKEKEELLGLKFVVLNADRLGAKIMSQIHDYFQPKRVMAVCANGRNHTSPAKLVVPVVKIRKIPEYIPPRIRGVRYA